MTIGPAPVCMFCKFYNEDDFEKNSCKAFPEGIPGEILLGGNKHSRPLNGQQNKIVFLRRLGDKL